MLHEKQPKAPKTMWHPYNVTVILMVQAIRLHVKTYVVYLT